MHPRVPLASKLHEIAENIAAIYSPQFKGFPCIAGKMKVRFNGKYLLAHWITFDRKIMME